MLKKHLLILIVGAFVKATDYHPNDKIVIDFEIINLNTFRKLASDIDSSNMLAGKRYQMSGTIAYIASLKNGGAILIRDARLKAKN